MRTIECLQKMAIIALVGVGLLAGAAVGLGVGLSRRSKGKNGVPLAIPLRVAGRFG